jgi:hypothetical protein
VRDRLVSALAPFRNREAAFALATFLARYRSHPDRLLQAFAIDRRALVGHADLDPGRTAQLYPLRIANFE